MGREAERDELLRICPPDQLSRALLERTRNQDVLVMHCLPGDRGEEITDAVADGPKRVLFPQAHNRLHAQKALLAHLIGGIPLK